MLITVLLYLAIAVAAAYLGEKYGARAIKRAAENAHVVAYYAHNEAEKAQQSAVRIERIILAAAKQGLAKTKAEEDVIEKQLAQGIAISEEFFKQLEHVAAAALAGAEAAGRALLADVKKAL